MARLYGENATLVLTTDKSTNTYSLSDLSVTIDNNCGCYDTIGGKREYIELGPKTISINGSLINNNFGYIETKKESKNKMGIMMRWVKPEELTEDLQGLLLLYEDKYGLFHQPESAVYACVVNGQLPRSLDISAYAGGLLVYGFELPDANSPLINAKLPVKVYSRGNIKDGTARSVFEFMNDQDYGLGLYAGLTVHDTLGSWSSWPAHEYEVNALVAPVKLFTEFSEKFAFMTEPSGLWLLQARGLANGSKSVHTFVDRDIIDIPLGAHPSVAAPGVRLAYFWAYTGAPHKDF